jgi:YD repeat-containing protein
MITHRYFRRTTLGNETTYTYDFDGNRSTMTDANGNRTTFVYDELNRLIMRLYADGTSDQTRYDAVGNSVESIDQAGIMTRFGYDLLKRLTTVNDAQPATTSYGYDEVGNRTSQTDANGHTTIFVYDELSRPIGRMLPAGQEESRGYDWNGNLLTYSDFNGHTTTYVYDMLDRLTQINPDPYFAATPVTFEYLANGQRRAMSDVTGRTSYSYDQRTRLVMKATPEGTLGFTYDASGNRLSMASDAADGVNVTYAWDRDERLSTVTDTTDGGGVTTYSYDRVGNILSTRYANGVTADYVFNNINRLTAISWMNGGSSLGQYVYTLNPTGKRTQVLEGSGRSVGWQYDSLYRLTAESISASGGGGEAQTVGYSYDRVGNRTAINSMVAGVPSAVSSVVHHKCR